MDDLILGIIIMFVFWVLAQWIPIGYIFIALFLFGIIGKIISKIKEKGE
jgi:hypothetical protein